VEALQFVLFVGIKEMFGNLLGEIAMQVGLRRVLALGQEPDNIIYISCKEYVFLEFDLGI
jgi:hypothetical protein